MSRSGKYVTESRLELAEPEGSLQKNGFFYKRTGLEKLLVVIVLFFVIAMIILSVVLGLKVTEYDIAAVENQKQENVKPTTTIKTSTISKGTSTAKVEVQPTSIIDEILSNPWTKRSLNEKRTTFFKDEIDNFEIDDLNLEKLLESMSVGRDGVDFKASGLRHIEIPHTFERYTTTRNFGESNRKKRNFIPEYDKYFRYWPNGTIPYYLHTAAFKDIELVESRLNRSMEHIEEETCIRFLRLSLEDVYALIKERIYHYVNITNNGPGSGCYSYAGRFTVYASFWGRAGQDLNLDESSWFCLTTDAIIHEIGHAIGMMHEFMRGDRDEHLTVNFANMQPGWQRQFAKMDSLELLVPFDYYSTMMYDTLATSVTGYPVLEARDPDLEFLISSGGYLSYYDKLNIQKAYECAAPCPDDLICENGGYKDHTCGCTCPDGLTGLTCNEVFNQELCGGIIVVSENQTTTVQSDFSSFPQEGSKCYWLLKAAQDYAITIEIEEFNFLYDNLTKRCYHWLEISYNLIGQPGPKRCFLFQRPVSLSVYSGGPRIYIIYDDCVFFFSLPWSTTYCGDSFSRGKISTSKYGEPNLLMLKLDTMSIADVPQVGGFKLTAQSYPVHGGINEGCGRPPIVENTSSNHEDVGSKKGEIVKYKCKSNYTMFGDLPAITCQADGTWSRVRFRCTLESPLAFCNFEYDDCGIIVTPFKQHSWKWIILDGKGFLRIEPSTSLSSFIVVTPFAVPMRLEPWEKYCMAFSMRRPLGNTNRCAYLAIYGIDPVNKTETYLFSNFYYSCMETEWTEYRKTVELYHPFFLKFYAIVFGYGVPFNLDVDNITVQEGRC